MIHTLVQLAYIVATALFIFSLHWMSDPKTARNGVYAGVGGMMIAVLATWAQPEIVHHAWIVIAIVLGFVVGVPLSQVSLTAVPQRTALSHAFGGAAAGLVGTAKYYLWLSEGPRTSRPSAWSRSSLEIVLGYLTFTGSLLAAGKLQELKWIPQRPVTYPGQNFVNLALARWWRSASARTSCCTRPAPASASLFPVVSVLSLIFGVLLIIPIGGADMPTVISILNSYAGLSAVAMGFVLDNKLLITAGALDGSSGLILSIIMCRAMNRSFTNVLFGAFGQVQATTAKGEEKTYKAETVEGAAQILEQASLVVIIPGYGMAVAQAQHKVREVYDALRHKGITVKFAIHPVAGRMPGHMNVLPRRGRDPVHRSRRDGRDQPRHAPVRRRARDRRQRRREPRRRDRQEQPHLRHAHHPGRQGAHGLRDQALEEPRLRRHRQRALLRRPARGCCSGTRRRWSASSRSS